MYIDFLLKIFKESIDRDAIIWKNNSYNYGWLDDNITKCQQLIDSHQLENGSVVALKGDFSPNSIALLLALIERSCIIVPLTNTSSKNENILFDIAQVEFVFRINQRDIISFESVFKQPENNYYKVIRKSKHPGLVLFTSGTSGAPKAAVHDFMVLLEKFKTRRHAFRTLNFLLFDHWGGLNTMFYILSNSGVVISTKDRNPENICRLIGAHQIELLKNHVILLTLSQYQ